MPLSEDERRILTEIEEQLYASDPGLARQVSSTTVFSAPLRRTRFAAAGVVVGLALTLLLLPVHYLLAFFIGFGLTFFCALQLEGGLRHLGRLGAQQVTQSIRQAGARDFFGRRGDRDDSDD